jgi:hypothetical protein
MKRILVLICFFSVLAHSQAPSNYYLTAAGKTGPFLVNALHNIIKNNASVAVASVSTAIQRIDRKSNGKVWDLYGTVPGGPQNYEYDFGTMACGAPLVESDCYELEYLWPKAWFNNDPVASTDLHNIFPVDGFMRSKRSSFPFGTASTASYLSLNWSRLGMCGDNGYAGTVFEPNTDIKGDIARTYFYIAIRYIYEDAFWSSSAATSQSSILPWQLSVLLSWNHTDPVSAKEKARNDSIYYFYQGNRNPFIDHPQFADSIWTAYIGLNALTDEKENYSVFPNPSVNGQTRVGGLHEGNTIEVRNTLGELVSDQKNGAEVLTIDLSSKPAGIYMVTVRTTFGAYNYKLVNSP